MGKKLLGFFLLTLSDFVGAVIPTSFEVGTLIQRRVELSDPALYSGLSKLAEAQTVVSIVRRWSELEIEVLEGNKPSVLKSISGLLNAQNRQSLEKLVLAEGTPSQTELKIGDIIIIPHIIGRDLRTSDSAASVYGLYDGKILSAGKVIKIFPEKAVVLRPIFNDGRERAIAHDLARYRPGVSLKSPLIGLNESDRRPPERRPQIKFVPDESSDFYLTFGELKKAQKIEQREVADKVFEKYLELSMQFSVQPGDIVNLRGDTHDKEVVEINWINNAPSCEILVRFTDGDVAELTDVDQIVSRKEPIIEMRDFHHVFHRAHALREILAQESLTIGTDIRTIDAQGQVCTYKIVGYFGRGENGDGARSDEAYVLLSYVAKAPQENGGFTDEKRSKLRVSLKNLQASLNRQRATPVTKREAKIDEEQATSLVGSKRKRRELPGRAAKARGKRALIDLTYDPFAGMTCAVVKRNEALQSLAAPSSSSSAAQADSMPSGSDAISNTPRHQYSIVRARNLSALIDTLFVEATSVSALNDQSFSVRFLDGKQTKVSIVDDLFVCIEGVYKIKCKNKMEAEKIYKTLLDWVSRKMRRVPVIPQGEHGYSSMYW